MRIPRRRLPEPTHMVVAPQPEAAEAGAIILRAGGNAVDATVAAALVQGIVDPIMCGIGGFAVLQVHQRGHMPVNYEGLGRVPAGATPDMWADRMLGETTDGFGFIVRDFVNEAGAASVMVPGKLAVLSDVHERYGRLPWADVVAPAIDVARGGWLLRPHVVTVFSQDERRYGRMNYGEKLGLSSDGRALYLRPDGSYKQLGERIVNPAFAESLEIIAAEGPSTLYGGSLGAHITGQIAAQGGQMALADLASYRCTVCDPVRIGYRGWGVSMPPPPGGGVFLAQALGLLERLLPEPADLRHNSAEHVRLLAEIMKAAIRDKERLGGDPDVAGDMTGPLLDPDYLRSVADGIRAGERVHVPRLGRQDSAHTTHLSAMDGDGLTVAMTHTLGNPSGFIADGTGFMFNGGMSVFDPRPGGPNSIYPGRRRLTTMAPTLLFDRPLNAPAGADSAGSVAEVEAVGTLGAPGASWIGPALLQVISNILDWGMGTQEAISAPRIVATSDVIDISHRITRAVQAELEADGYSVRRSPLTYAFAGVHGITRFGGRLNGGADPQRDGYAAGV